MRVVYASCVRLGGGGIGSIARNAALASHRAGLLERLFVSSAAPRETTDQIPEGEESPIPCARIRSWGLPGRSLRFLASRDASGLVYYVEGLGFDAWTAAALPAAELFHGWPASCLRTLRLAGQRGTLAVLERASSHPATQKRLLDEERERWGLRSKAPSWNHERSIAEIEEADRVVIPSDFVRESMLEAGVAEKKLVQIPFGVDLERFHPAESRRDRPFRVAFAGQLCLRKGVPDLLEAWRRLDLRGAELWLVGQVRPDFAALRSRWTELQGLRYLGYSEQLPEVLRQCDVFAFPTLEEGSALVTYEAMASGLPVVTTPNAGSVIRDGEDGYLIPIRDCDALCQRLHDLHADAGLRGRLGASARRRAEAFPWSRYREELVARYREMVGS